MLLIDTYEALLPLDSWLRESFLPELPDATIVVIAGRQAPASTWRTDPEWAELAHILPLRNLPPDDSRAYLRACGISDHQQSPVLDFTHGHPLALALVADLLVRGEPLDFSPDYSPDVVRSLLQRVVEQLPGGAHYHALEVCARTRVTTQELLNHVLGRDEAASAFEWLRGLSFIEHTPDGVVPHDLAREILDADLRWRDPEGYRDLHGRILRYLVGRLQTRTGREQQRAYFDFVYLSRTSPVMRSYYDWETMTAAYAEPANPADYDSILTMVRRHEGRASERVAEFWLRRRPDAFVAFRRAGQQLSDSQQCCCWRRLIRRNARLTRRLPRHGVSPTTVSHCDQVSACSTIVTG